MLDYMEKERGIKRELLLDAVQTALLAAARKSFGPARDLTVALDRRPRRSRPSPLLVVEKVTQAHDEISLPKARLIKPTPRSATRSMSMLIPRTSVALPRRSSSRR